MRKLIMTKEELKLKEEADAKKAKEEADAKAAALKAEQDKKKNEEGGTKDDSPGEDDPMWSDPAKVKSYIKDLRKENAGYRTKAKDFQTKLDEVSGRFSKLEGGLKNALGLKDEDDLDPEEKVKHLSQKVDGLHFESAVNEIFIEQGLPGGKKGAKYLSFLLQEAASELGENEEVSEEKMEEIVSQVKMTFGSKQSSTSVDGNGNTPPKPGDSGTVTLDEFVSMSIASKTELYSKNKSLYEGLMKQAKTKGLLK
jgi:hypothetical protein